MKDGAPKRINVTVRLEPTDVAVLRAEAARRVQAGAKFDYSQLIREQLRLAPWYPRGGDDHVA